MTIVSARIGESMEEFGFGITGGRGSVSFPRRDAGEARSASPGGTPGKRDGKALTRFPRQEGRSRRVYS